MTRSDAWRADTQAIALGRPHDPDAPLNVPIIPATMFLAGPGPGYSRAGNDTWSAFESVVGTLEGGQALAFGSGMAAIAAALDVATGRARADGAETPVVATPHVHYSGSRGLLGKLRDEGRLRLRTYQPEDSADACAAAAAADITFVESPANPTMEITDIAAVCRASRGPVIADNTYATPLATRPLELGADLVVHSASKYLAGHSDALLGAVVTAPGAEDLHSALATYRVLHGAVPGVLEAWLGTRGVRTLPLRVRAATANAGIIAERLAERRDVIRVRYPGLEIDPGHPTAARQMSSYGAVVVFVPTGGELRAQSVCETTELWLHATSLGGVESTLERRRRHPDETTDVPADLIRLSVGCEDVEDLWADLSAALDATP